MQKLEQHIFVILSHKTHDGQLDIAIRKRNQFLLAFFKYNVHCTYDTVAAKPTISDHMVKERRDIANEGPLYLP